jgi:predicted GNAT family N-acyltransferase
MTFMIQLKKANSQKDLLGILDLQAENHLTSLSPEEKMQQGFVTVRHSLGQLQELNAFAQHIIAVDSGKVVGYILAMTKHSKNLIPVLIPMFEQFDMLTYKNKKMSEHDFMVIGQVCVDKAQRGKGLFDRMYKAYREYYSSTFDFAITEIALSNQRSMAAHLRIGFQVIHEFKDETQLWAIVVWDWK